MRNARHDPERIATKHDSFPPDDASCTTSEQNTAWNSLDDAALSYALRKLRKAWAPVFSLHFEPNLSFAALRSLDAFSSILSDIDACSASSNDNLRLPTLRTLNRFAFLNSWNMIVPQKRGIFKHERFMQIILA